MYIVIRFGKTRTDRIYYPRFSNNLIVISVECTLENLEIFWAQTHFKIVIFTREGDWYGDIYPRHPLYLRSCRSRRRRFVWISLTVSRTRHGGWKRKKHRPTACSSRLQLTREQSRVRFTDEVVSSMKNDSKRDRFIVGPSSFLLAFEKKGRKRRGKKEKKEINANESILWGWWNVSSHISEMMIIHRNNSRSVALKVIPRNWVS